MANKKRTSQPHLVKKIKSEFSCFQWTDTNKVMLEIMCELMIKELGAILTQIQVENKKSLNLSTYEDMKKLMTRILISKTEMNDKQRTYAQYELVKVFFKYFLVTQIKSVRYLNNSLFRVSPCKGKILLVLLFHRHTHVLDLSLFIGFIIIYTWVTSEFLSQ